MPEFPFVRVCAAGIDLDVWVVPRAAKPGLGPCHGERLRAAVSAPPVEGAANDAVRALVADTLGVARGAVTILRGATGRQKTLRVSGDRAALLARLGSLGLASAGADARKKEAETTSRKR